MRSGAIRALSSEMGWPARGYKSFDNAIYNPVEIDNQYFIDYFREKIIIYLINNENISILLER